MKKVGIVFGTFAPMHRGHIDLIIKAKRICDSVKVIVSGREGDRGDNIGLSLQKRFRYIREVFNDDSLVEVSKLDEANMPLMPEGWDVWLDELFNVSNTNKDDDLLFFVNEDEYVEELQKRGFKTQSEERNFGISASLIRENPFQYWRFIAQPFKRHFTKKVLVLGSASNGKTTLVKDLGLFYSAPTSLEYAREYQTTNNVRDDELTAKDYFYLLDGQYAQTSKAIDSKENKGLVIADTNSTVTKAYYDYYLDESSSDTDLDIKAVEHLYKSLVTKEKWDLILFVQPTGEYVDDGFRDMTMADEQIRQAFTDYLLQITKENHANTKLIFLDEDYLGNYNKAIKEIEAIYKEY
jgi:bifunctional nadR protein